MIKNTKIKAYLLLSLTPYTTLAVGTKDAEKNLTKAARQANVWERTLGSIAGDVIKSVLIYTGVVMLLLMSYAGVLWMTAGGNEEQINKAKKIIKGSVIGFLVVILSYTIVFGIASFANNILK